MNRGHFPIDRQTAARIARQLRALYRDSLPRREANIVIQMAVDNYLSRMHQVRMGRARYPLQEPL